MPALFATSYAVPVSFAGYPVGLAIAVPESRQQLYVEREYVGTAVIRATPITGAGLVYWQESQVPEGCREIRVSIRNYDRKTEADPVAAPSVTQDERARFNTHLTRPVLFDGYPVNMGIAIGETRQTLYLEREYISHDGFTLDIRADLITDRGALMHFNIHQEAPPVGTRFINACITNAPRALEDLIPSGIYWIDYDGAFVADYDNAIIPTESI